MPEEDVAAALTRAGPRVAMVWCSTLAAITRSLWDAERRRRTGLAPTSRRALSNRCQTNMTCVAGPIETRPHKDAPLMDGARVLFGNDVWEHGYCAAPARPKASL